MNDGRPLSMIDNRIHIQKWTSQRSDEPKLTWFNSKSYIAAKGKYVSTSSDHGIQFSFEPSYIEVILPASCIEIRGKSAVELQTKRRSRSGAGSSFMPLMFVSLKTKLESKLVFDLPAYAPFEVPTNWWPMQLTGDRQAAAFLSNSLTGTVFTNGETSPIVPGQSVMLSNITSMNSTKEHIRFNTRSGDAIIGGHMQSKRLITYLTGEYWAAFAAFLGAFIAYLQWRRR